MSKEGYHCICLSTILIDSVLKRIKAIIRKCLKKNVKVLLKKIR